MDITGEYQLPARREVVWAALNDPETLKTCIPGCEALARHGDTLTGSFDLSVGHVNGAIASRLAYGSAIAPEHLTLAGAGEGSHAGSLRGEVSIVLAEAGEATRLAYVARIEAGGALAGVEPQTLEAAARDFADTVFGALAARVAAEPTVAAPPLATTTPDEAAEDELVDRIEHRVDDEATNVGEIVEEVEQEIEVAAGRGVLGGPYVWGLIALLVVIVALAILR